MKELFKAQSSTSAERTQPAFLPSAVELLSTIATSCTCNASWRKASNGGSQVALTLEHKRSSFSRIQLESL